MGIHEEANKIAASHWTPDLPEGELEVMKPDDGLPLLMLRLLIILAICAVLGFLCALVVE